jgi:hypothetical protein
LVTPDGFVELIGSPGRCGARRQPIRFSQETRFSGQDVPHPGNPPE